MGLSGFQIDIRSFSLVLKEEEQEKEEETRFQTDFQGLMGW